MNDDRYQRTCPSCKKIIIYSSKSSLNRAIKKGNKPCQSCFIKSLWEDENSSLRKEETKLKRNASISAKRQDPNSSYNTDEYKEKQSLAHKAIRTSLSSYTSDEYKNKQSKALKEVWKRPEYREKRLSKETLSSFSKKMSLIWKERYFEFIEKLNYSWDNKERRQKAKDRFLILLESEEFRKKLWRNNSSIRVSKLELKIKQQLEELGFKHSSEHKIYINRKLPDFLNVEDKSIIEIYGDYWHCNPKIEPYNNPDWYHSRLKMYSSDKWLMDYSRVEMLKSEGYSVKIFWESDIKKFNFNINELINKEDNNK